MIDYLRQHPFLTFLAALIILLVIWKLSSASDQEKYVMMPFAYVTPDVVKVAQQGGPRLYFRASTLPENWTGYLENSDGTPYNEMCQDPHQVIYARSLKKTLLDDQKVFHCFYNTSVPTLTGHLQVQLDSDRNWTFLPTGDAVTAPGPGEKTGCTEGHAIQGPQCYDPEKWTEEVHAPNITGFQFTCSYV